MASKIDKPNIPQRVRLQVWSTAGGRCSFRGCNKPLWYDGLTLAAGNFSDMAHIIGASKDGPRGNEDSERLAKDPHNIMLVCKECHKRIDDNPQTYEIDILRAMKLEHEGRIERVTEISFDQKTEILIFMANINKRPVVVDKVEVERTILRSGLYPASKSGLIIDRTKEDGDGLDDHWKYNREKIERDFEKVFVLCNQGISHLSVFALGPIPYLFLLGKLITDTRVNRVEVFQRNRKAQCWDWPSDIENKRLPTYRVVRPLAPNSANKPVLLLALSDYIQSGKYEGLWSDEMDIYTVTLDGAMPNRDYLQHPEQVGQLVQIFHELLNELQAIYGAKTTLHLLPAVPLSIAVRCGMVLLPKKEMPILIYDLNWDFGGFRPIFTI